MENICFKGGTVRYGGAKLLFGWFFFLLKKRKLYYSFLWMVFNCLKATEPLQRGSLPFTTKSPGVPGTSER